ncbi:hypothetical protein LTR05_001398 [Lithohypha guttulata]|uniref:Uncharacterized protein n=1 Tax=Lithohypha guttulata TaxID=1690604 RepID=A0AAN7YF29_9EURO|nr:hypothetical protein LTR05_001398 [Lithohypha guttulata]
MKLWPWTFPGRASTFWAKRNPFLRSLGFELPFIFGIATNTEEKPKEIIQPSRPLAIARCSIHVLPICVSVTILVLNFGNSYLGRGLPGSIIDPSINIALLQVAAKIQELLIVASVTTIVMHVLRSELVHGEGLPLGLLAGGFLYSSLSYFWSPEFWGSFYSKAPWITHLRVYGIIVLGGLIAVFAGPSTAILLVPREQPWPAGGTTIYLPGPADHWWPTYINNTKLALLDGCAHSNSSGHPLCPKAAFPAIWGSRNSIDILDNRGFAPGTYQNLTTSFSFGPSTVDLPSNLDLLPNLRYHGTHRGYACETSMWGPRAAEAVYGAQLKQDWIDEAFALPYNIIRYGPSLTQYKYFGSMEVKTTSRIPTVRAACSASQILSTSENSVLFPVLPQDTCWTSANVSSVVIDQLNPTTTDRVRTTWVSLPQNLGSVSGGIVVEIPSADEHARVVVGCTLDARWTEGKIITYHLEDASSLEKVAKQILITTSLLEEPVSASGRVPGYSDFSPVTSSPSTKITFDKSWLEALTPILPLETSTGSTHNLTTLESILSDLNFVSVNTPTAQEQGKLWDGVRTDVVNRTVALEWWLALLVTDGLARLGTNEVLNTTGLQAAWSLLNYVKADDFRNKLFKGRPALMQPNAQTVIQRRVSLTIGGYSYKASSITDYASAVLLLTHMLLALAHSLYIGWWTGRSSSSWDSLTELMVLMQNSTPATKVLQNTNAGISELRTYSRKAKAYAVRDISDLMSEATVELSFDDARTTRVEDIDAICCHGRSTHDQRPNSVSSVNSKSPLLLDTEFVTLHQSTFPMHGNHSAHSTTLRRRRMYERILPDVKYR